MEENMEKPITLIIKETKKSLYETINNSGLPAFVLYPLIKDILFDVKTLNDRLEAEDEMKYRQSLEENVADVNKDKTEE